MHSCIITPVGITQYHCVLRGGTAIQRTADKMLESIQLKAPTTDMMDKCERCETRSTAMETIGPYATSALATTPSHVIRGLVSEGGAEVAIEKKKIFFCFFFASSPGQDYSCTHT